jgi:hypothetical protein
MIPTLSNNATPFELITYPLANATSEEIPQSLEGKTYDIQNLTAKDKCKYLDMFTANTQKRKYLASVVDANIANGVYALHEFKVENLYCESLTCTRGFLFCASSAQIQIWSAQSRELKITFKCSNDVSIVTSCEDMLFFGCKDGTIEIWKIVSSDWSVPSLTKVDTLPGHNSEISSLAAAYDNQLPLVFSGHQDGTIQIWDSQSMTCANLEGKDQISSLAVGKSMFFAGLGNGQVQVWDRKTQSCMYTLQAHSTEVSLLAISNEKKGSLLLFSGSNHGEIKIWNVTSAACRPALTLEKPNSPTRICSFAIQGDFLLSSSTDAKLKIWKIGSKDPLHTFNVLNHYCAVSSKYIDGKYFIHLPNKIYVFDFTAAPSLILEQITKEMESEKPFELQNGWERFLNIPKSTKQTIYQHCDEHNDPVEKYSSNTSVNLTPSIDKTVRAIRRYMTAHLLTLQNIADTLKNPNPLEAQKGWEQFLNMPEFEKREICQYYYQHNNFADSFQSTPNTNFSVMIPMGEVAKTIQDYLRSQQ